MPTAAEYAKSGGYARDAQISKDFAKVSLPKSPSSSSGSSGSSSSTKKKTPTPAPTSGGYMNTPIAGGSTPPMPSPYQSGGSTYTPGPSNWGGMDQSQRDTYTTGVIGPGMIKRGGSAPPINKISVPGSWPEGVPQGGSVPPLINKISIPGQWSGTPAPYSPTPGSNQQYKIAVPGQWGGTSAPPPIPFPVKTPEAIAAEAKARTDALLAKQTTIAGQTKQGFNTAYDRLKATTKDDRILADAAFQRNTNPYSGSTDNQRDMTGRQRTIEDSNSQQDLQTRLANVDLSLADYTNATEAQRMQMETDMTNQERAYGLQVDQLALQRRGQEQNQSNADRQFNYGVGRDAVGDSRYADTTNYNRGRDNVTDSRYTDTTNYNRGRDGVTDSRYNDTTNYNRSQDQITNNRNAANDALTLRKQHIDEANYYSDKYGVPVDPKDDFQLVLDQVAGLPTVAQKTAAQKSQDTQRAEAWKIVEFLGSVPEVYSDLLGVPAGTQSQKAKEAAMDAAYKNRTLAVSQQNANTSSSSAANSNALAKDRLSLDRQKSTEGNLAQLTDSLNHTFGTFDSYSGKFQGVDSAKLPQLRQAIINMNLPDYQTDQILASYGLPTN